MRISPYKFNNLPSLFARHHKKYEIAHFHQVRNKQSFAKKPEVSLIDKTLLQEKTTTAYENRETSSQVSVESNPSSPDTV